MGCQTKIYYNGTNDFGSGFSVIFSANFFEAPIYIPRTDFSGTFVASTFKTLTVLKHFARPSPFRTSPHFMRTLLCGVVGMVLAISQDC